MIEFRTTGTCSKKITFSIEDGLIRSLAFDRGCNGNSKALARLIEGKPAGEIAETLMGIQCGGRGTSCADQLARAIAGALAEDGRGARDGRH